MSAPTMDDLKSSKEENSSEQPDTESEVPEEVQNAPSVNVRPEAALAFDEIVDFGFTGDVDDEQNIKGEPTTGYGGAIAITVRNPTVSGGQLWKSTDDGQTADYRLVGPETTSLNTHEIDGEEHVLGIEYGDRTFDSEQVEDFDEEYATVYLSGGMGEYVSRRIDAGGGFSYADDNVEANFDEPVPLFEYPPEGSDKKGAVRRQPILRADFTGGGAIMVEGDTDEGFAASVFMETEDGEFLDLDDRAIDSMDHEGYLDTSAVYIGNFVWENHSGAEDDGNYDNRPSEQDDTSADESETVDSVDDLEMNLGDDTGEDVLTYEDLTPAWTTFVNNLVDAIEEDKVDGVEKVPALAEDFVADNGDVVSWDDVDGLDTDAVRQIVETRSDLDE